MFSSILTDTTSSLSVTAVLICIATALACGLIVSLVYKVISHPTKSFSLCLAVLPVITMIIILMVNGNLGVGVAVAGSFSLVRFRSLPGKASDILAIFLAMALGLATGMGYVWFALASAVIVSLILALLSVTSVLDQSTTYRNMRITIPEDLDYISVFDEVFRAYAKKADVQSVRTINLGTMYQVEYDVVLKDVAKEKDLIDQIRVRNGNLPVISGRTPTVAAEL